MKQYTREHKLIGVDLARIFASWSWATSPTTPGTIVGGLVSYPEIAPLSFFGRFGVEIFFVVSGFVIGGSSSQVGPWTFFRARVLRLWPGVLICATISLSVALAVGWQEPSRLLAAYLRAIAFEPYGPWIDGVYWTLDIEICFYALVFVLLLARRREWLEPIVAVIGVTSTAYWAWMLAVSAGFAPPLDFGIGARERDLVISYGAHFGLGVVLWAAFAHGWRRHRIILVVTCALGCLIELYVIAPSYMQAVDMSLRVVPAAIWLAAIALMASLVWLDGTLRNHLPASILRNVAWAGLATFPLYLLHTVVGAATIKVLAAIGLNRYVALGAAMLVVVVLALLVTATAEPLLRRLVVRVLDGLRRVGKRSGAPGEV